jgi:pimeloyl-ACP methyl ester carboxylesterase
VTQDFEFTACRFPTPPDQNPTCGDLTVPLDRNDSDSTQTIQLHVAIFHSTSPNPEPDPLILLHGGPGSSMLERIAFWYQEQFSDIIATRDLIVFDQRGVGYAEPSLDCPGFVDQFYASLSQDLRVGLAEWEAPHASVCLADLAAQGVNLVAYNSAASAADVNDLRLALGYERVNLYGASYGSRLALTVMRGFGAGGTIRSVILDSVYPPQVNLDAARPQNLERALQAVFAACAADADCDAAYPDLETVFFDLVEQLNAYPVTLDVMNNVTGRQQTVVVNGNRLIEMVYRISYQTGWLPWLPKLFYHVQDGHFEIFSEGLQRLFWLVDGVQPGPYFAVQCYEEVAFNSVEAVDTIGADAHPLLSAHLTAGAKATLATCAALGLPPADPIEDQPVVSDVPALILSGTFDPATPPAWGKLAADGLSNAFFYEFPNASHGVMSSVPCAQNLVAQFIADPTTMPDAGCMDDLDALSFELP